MNALLLLLTLLVAGGDHKTVSTEAAPTQAAEVKEDPIWASFQKMLDLGIKEINYTGKYGDFSHNAYDYKALKNSSEGQGFLKSQQELLKKTVAPGGRFDKLAFWMNAYNFFTLVEINSNYPVKSMKDIGWKKKHHSINGTMYSLDQIEHKIIRPMKDPRIHFAVNCASVSCPSLSPKVFVGKGVGLQMNDLVKNAFKNPLHFRLDGGDLQSTKLLDWFGGDFKVALYGSKEKFINKFAPAPLKKSVDGWISYDWDLNNPENIKSAMKKLGVTEK
jgi:hypothetical protein